MNLSDDSDCGEHVESVADHARAWESTPFKQRLAELERARENAIEHWRSQAIPRELPRIGLSPHLDSRLTYLSERGIQSGEFITTTKLQLEHQMMPGDGRTLRDRVWACGLLATIGYMGELAVKLIRNKIRPLTARDIRKRLDEAAERWIAFGGFQSLTESEKKLFHVDKANLRRALAGLEEEGKALRTLVDGTPLRGLPREKTKGLHEGDVLLFFFFRPISAEPGTVVTRCLPRFASLSPLRAISDGLKVLELSLSPEEVATNNALKTEFEAALNDYFEKEAGVNRDCLKMKAVARETAQNRVLVAARQQRIDITPDRKPEICLATCSSSSSSSAPGPAAAATKDFDLLDPRQPPVPVAATAAADVSEAAPATVVRIDVTAQEFEARLIRSFVDAGKDWPTPIQIRNVVSALPDHPQARAQFLLHLQRKMLRIKHPGVLPSIVAGFVRGWSALLETIEKSEWHEHAPTPPFNPERISAYLLQSAQQLRARPEFGGIAVELENMSSALCQGHIGIELLETDLKELGGKMLEIARALADANGQLLEIDAQLNSDPQLAKYKRRMTPQQFDDMYNQHFNRKLTEDLGLPQLSIFKMS